MMKFSPSLELRASRAELWNPGRDAFFINGEAWSSDGEALRLGGGVLSVMKAAGRVGDSTRAARLRFTEHRWWRIQARKLFAFRRLGAMHPA